MEGVKIQQDIPPNNYFQHMRPLRKVQQVAPSVLKLTPFITLFNEHFTTARIVFSHPKSYIYAMCEYF